VRRATIVGQIADRFRWWANPPAVARPTPALAGWTVDEWLDQAGVQGPAPDERYRTQYPAALPLYGYDAHELARDALRALVLEDQVEPVPGRDSAWRARPKERFPG
jgi:hypothetical protein